MNGIPNTNISRHQAMDYLWDRILEAWKDDNIGDAMAFEYVLSECEGLTDAEFVQRFPRAHLFVNV